MKSISKILFFLALAFPVYAGELTYDFGNPAFSGNGGYSTHVLSVEQLQYQRKQQVEDERKAEQARLEREENSKTINKFVANVESRIYANLSKQLVDNMFGESCNSSTEECPLSGSATVEGAEIYWVRDTTAETISLTVTAEDGTITELVVPLGDFAF